MDFEQIFKQVLKETEIVRSRISSLHTFEDTNVPYILLTPSSINTADTVVRKGEVVVQKPSLILPPNIPQFDGFEFDDLDEDFQEDGMMNFFMIRGVQLPSLHYNNHTYSLDVFEGDLDKCVKHYESELAQQENVSTGLLIGSEEYWQFSLLVFISSQVSRNAQMDFKKLLNNRHQF